ERLHGYNGLSIHDIVHHKPASPLVSTIWLACATLDAHKTRNIALEWFMSKASCCLLASTEPVKTTDNQKLNDIFLAIFEKSNSKSLADIIFEILNQDQTAFESILAHYRLLGIPWVRMA